MKAMVFSLAVLTATVSVMVSATSAPATTALRPLTLPELTSHSDLVVHGTIRSIRSQLVAERGIFTRVEIEPLETLKGVVPGETATLWAYGGAWEDLRTIIEGWPCMHEGEEVVLFLAANGPGTYDLVNLAEGKFLVERGGSGTVSVTRDLRGIAYLEPTAPVAIPAELDDLRAAVRGSSR